MEVTDMTEMNKKLDDSKMAQANGGTGEQLTQFDAYGIILSKTDEGYLVRLDNGEEITVVYEGKHIISNGARVGLIMLDGGWEMEDISCF